MSQDLTADNDVAARAAALMLEQDKDRPRFLALVALVAGELQSIRTVLQSLYDGRMLDNATGASLDALGWLVGEPRNGRADDLYRSWIRVRIIVNRTNGKINDSLRVARLLVEASPTLQYVENPPAGYIIENTNSAFDETVLRQVLDLVRGAGITMQLHTVPDSDHDFLLYDVGGSAPSATVHGLGDTGSPAIGGILSSSF